MKVNYSVLGQSGSSKSTIFMEIICDYFDEGFAILYNEGTTDIKNPDGLVNFIEDLLKDERKVLVAIDNAHDEKTSSIFYVIDKSSTSQLTTNLMFIITARMPEFDLFAKDRLDREQEQIRKSIRKLIGDTKFRYQVPYFSKGEIKEFIRLYLGITDECTTNKKSQEIYDYTKGDPIMVKFAVFGQGLDKNVDEMYHRNLKSQLEMKTMLICSLLDISNIEITDKVYRKMWNLMGAYNFDGKTLSQSHEGSWRTKHTR